MKTMTNDLLFVYGTLRRQAATDSCAFLALHSDFFSAGYIQGKLFEVEGYPGAVLSDRENDKVFGELYRISAPKILWPRLDDYEECSARFPQPHEYLREKINVSLPAGEQVKAWVYLYNRDTSNLAQIASGDYLLYLRKS
jgi:gamma-glutamylcyclotransferase (GGCT)/AIG2-like uncharacterized protein YtfP